MDRASLITLIHVAKKDLRLDAGTYCDALRAAVGKTSCRDMTQAELSKVLTAFQRRGFKVRSKPQNRALKPASIPAKIRAVWKNMHADGFIQSGDEMALNAWIQRQTARLNEGEGVAQLVWLNRDGEMAAKVLECLKKWHRRCMIAAMPPGHYPRGYDALCDRFRAGRRC
ncbi:DUF1018 domain-containing protein [Salmonella enterica]|nr:DUF1018 domain-containing protein [Salmonella enterica]EKC5843358.1 DUF1018 domain-containing protein [Salmonella enterica]EKC7207058.1 DUF1018 domain-containing protein [Salmonella enterica]EKC7461591.1 DUF1018 domain-containing protein [Salmonella enterica]EKC7507443.1 DUF1018 domain-containing protein [Salmonella enterica]